MSIDWMNETADESAQEDAKVWLQRMASRGWTVPSWPKEYGGGGLAPQEHMVFVQEMARISARPATMGMGISMFGPTLLEFGTEEQKHRHIPNIVYGSIQWCQGYSEPGAGSDLANVQSKAVPDGDNYVINGSKIWTSGAQRADWMFALVRTDPDAPKHDGISFILLDMNQPGVSIKPIRLIAGSSPFCETFFDNAVASKDDIIGGLNKGWTVGKRLLQHERGGQGGLGAGGGTRRRRGSAPQRGRRGPAADLIDTAITYVGEKEGRIADPVVRDQIIQHAQVQQAMQLTQRRAGEENRSGKTEGDTTSIFKLVGSTLAKESANMKVALMGSQGYGWEGDEFTANELQSTRSWLSSRAITIYGGTNEIQMNIISKRVLGLPD
jgi:alkylation response protein AidB-like acyl-CoA dehydrogenase